MTLAYIIVLGVFGMSMFGLGHVFGELEGYKEGKRHEKELQDMKSMWRES